VVADTSVEMITGAQVRAARALIGWSATTLSEHCGVSYPTIQRAESVDGIPRLQASNLAAIQRTLEAAGVVFLDDRELRDGGPGVRLTLGGKDGALRPKPATRSRGKRSGDG
jgi:ribosome-binding protein aMBF1 (putative translation factor)